LIKNTINFAIIGCGRIAERHIDAIVKTKNANIIAVCDFNEIRAKEKAKLLDLPSYVSYHEMINLHPEVDVVIISTPSGMHFEHAKDMLQEYNKHVLLEKPIVMTIEQGLKLKQIADQLNLFIFPIYQHRFNKAVQKVKNAIVSENVLGNIRVGTVRVRWCRPQRYYDLSPWRGTWAMDGGAMMNQGIHYIDLLRYLCGEIKQVHAKLATFGSNIEVEDTAIAILEFESGALGIIEVMTSARPDDFEASISCVCDKGLAVISGIATNELKTFTPDPSQEKCCSEIFETAYGNGHNEIIRGVVNTLLEKRNPVIDFDDGMRTIQLLHALYRSDEINGWVNVKTAISERLGRLDMQNNDLKWLAR